MALSHVTYNAAAQQVSPRAKIVAAGSKTDKEQTFGDAARLRQDADTAAQQVRIDARPESQTPQQEGDARRRAGSASEKLGGGRRRKASQTLTDPGNLLSGSLAGSYGP